MAKFTPIRITKNDRAEHARLVRNTKAKIRRTQRNHGIDLSDEVSTPSIEEFSTRKHYNKWKEEQRSFTNRANLGYQFQTNKYGFTASKREIQQMERDTRIVRSRADEKVKELSKLPTMKNAEQSGKMKDRITQIGRSNATGITKPPEFDFKKVTDRSHFKRKQEAVERRLDQGYFAERAKTMKGNFVQKLLEQFNSDADEVSRKIENMDNNEFYEMYIMNKTDIDFDYLYTEDPQQNRDFAQKIEDAVDKYQSGNVNRDLEGF